MGAYQPAAWGVIVLAVAHTFGTLAVTLKKARS